MMNKWKIKYRCICSILRGQGVIYGVCFAKEVHIHRTQKNLVVTNCMFLGDMPRGPLNTQDIIDGVTAWLKR